MGDGRAEGTRSRQDGGTAVEAPRPSRRAAGGGGLATAAGNRAVTSLVADHTAPGPLGVLVSSGLEGEAHAAARHVLAAPSRPVSLTGRAPTAVIQLSPLSTRIDDDVQAAGKDVEKKRTLVLHRLRTFGPAANDLHASAAVDKAFAQDFLARWYARKLLKVGPEALWTAQDLLLLRVVQRVFKWLPDLGPSRATLDDVTGVIAKQGGKGTETVTLPIEAWYFPGATSDRALVVGGFHGTERAGIEVATRLKDQLLKSTTLPHFTTIVVPTLYPLNAEHGRRLLKAGKPPGYNEERWVRDAAGKKRSAAPGTGYLDPNRTLPDPTVGLTIGPAGVPVDALGRPMPPETVALVKLIERFKPTRIASVHGVHGTTDAGVYVDPDTKAVAKDPALASLAAPAREVAFAMALQTAGVPPDKAKATAKHPDVAAALADPADPKKTAAAKKVVKALGVDPALVRERVAGNRPGGAVTTDYTAASINASKQGTSLGGYGTVATPGKKPAAVVLTVEVAKNVPSDEIKDPKKKAAREAHLEAQAESIRDIFLQAP